MLKKILHYFISKLERKYGYDAGYLHAMIESSPALAREFSHVPKLSQYRKKAPVRLHALAGLAAAKSEDCGPCLQLGIDMSHEAGVDTETLKKVVKNPEQLSGDDKLVFDYATAVANNAADAESLRQQVEKKFGRDILIELAMAIATTRVYPALKRGMGYAKSCQIVNFDFKKAS
jgi:hypothetical protein